MKTSLTIAIFLTVIGITSAYTPEEIATESKKANDFFEKCWDETLSRHPVDGSFYGIKTHYDQLEDLSDEKATADQRVWERQLADLKKNIKFDVLDAQTRLSYKLFDRLRQGGRRDPRPASSSSCARISSFACRATSGVASNISPWPLTSSIR